MSGIRLLQQPLLRLQSEQGVSDLGIIIMKVLKKKKSPHHLLEVFLN